MYLISLHFDDTSNREKAVPVIEKIAYYIAADDSCIGCGKCERV